MVLTVLTGLGNRYFGATLVPDAILWLAALFTVVSGLQYIVQGMRFLNAAHADEREAADESAFLR